MESGAQRRFLLPPLAMAGRKYAARFGGKSPLTSHASIVA
jgi:hypothetical protein